MAGEPEPINIDDSPELLRLVEEMETAGHPCVLRRDGKDVAVVTPVLPLELTSARPVSRDSGLSKLIGIGSTAEPSDIGAHKHDYLAEAQLDRHRE